MKLIKTLLTILFISLLSSPSWSAAIDDIVEREGVYYKKFTDVPFNGEVTGREQGSFKNGKRHGAWVWYYENGQLSWKISYNNGYFTGDSVSYYRNGQLKWKGAWKSNMREGVWVSYNKDGTVKKEYTGTFKNGVNISIK